MKRRCIKKKIIIGGVVIAVLSAVLVLIFTREKNNQAYEYANVQKAIDSADNVLGNTYQNFTLPDDFEICCDEKLYTFTASRDIKVDQTEKIRELSQKLYGKIPDEISPYEAEGYTAQLNTKEEIVDFLYYSTNTFFVGYGRSSGLSNYNGYEKYLLGSDNIDGVSYKLEDGDMQVLEAVDMAHRYIKENLMGFLPNNSDVKPKAVSVFKSDKNNSCYCVTFENVFEGVPISSVGGIIPYDEFMRPQYIECWIYRRDRVEFTWNKYYLNIKDKEQVKEIITLESALRHLEKELAPKSNYEFLDITLEYCSKASDTNAAEFDYRPMWCFTVDSMIGTNANPNPRTVIYLDAISGEIFCYNDKTNEFVF